LGTVFVKYFKRKPAPAPAPMSVPSRAEQDTVPAAFGGAAADVPNAPPAPPKA